MKKNNALEKLEEKNADMIILNSLNDTGAGLDMIQIRSLFSEKKEKNFSLKQNPKKKWQKILLILLIRLYYA